MIEDTAVMRYTAKYGSFDSNGYELDDPILEHLCQTALDKGKEIDYSDLYADEESLS